MDKSIPFNYKREEMKTETKTIKLDDDTVKSYLDLSMELEENESISFYAYDLYYSCWLSDSNDGWYYTVIAVEDIPKDDEGNYLTDEIDDEHEIVGGLCTGSALDAIDMLIG